MNLPAPPRRRRPASELLALLLAAAPMVHAAGATGVQIEGQAIPAAATVAGTPLVLNGVGVRAWTIYKMYIAALYLPRHASTGAAVVAQPGPKRVQLRILLSVGGASGYLADAFTGGIRKRTTAAEYDAMQARVMQFDRLVRSLDTHKGDVVNLDFVPGAGLTLSLNGRVVGAPVPGADLYGAMLRIWVGDDARDQPLRAAMLGGAAS